MKVSEFDLQPRLTGKLISLRPLRRDDFEKLYAVASDPLIWEQHPIPRYKIEPFTTFFNEFADAGNALVVIDNVSGDIIGSSSYYGLEENAVRIGYTFLARSHWGGEVNGEMKRLMLDHAFGSVEKVYFDIAESNHRSRRAMEKIGGRFVRKQVLKELPYTLYVIERLTWAGSQGPQ